MRLNVTGPGQTTPAYRPQSVIDVEGLTCLGWSGAPHSRPMQERLHSLLRKVSWG